MKVKMTTTTTDRDRKLMALLAHYGMLSTPQIRRLLFAEIRKTTFLRRLRALEKEKWIRRQRALPDGGHVWFLARGGELKLGLRNTAPGINRNSIEHDLTLIEVRMALERISLGANWISEQTLRRKLYSYEKPNDERLQFIPDAIFSAQVGDKFHAVALEIETSPKTLARYEKIFKRYVSQRNITFVWYLVDKESFGHGLLSKWKTITPSSDHGFFAFSLISDLKANPRKAKIHFIAGQTSVEKMFILPDPAHTAPQAVSGQEVHAQ